ncbi:hypothetical protein CCACVL1_13342 [Corchorus capsularis]|uniref:Uncharacterized protein n=1 Tax=Corchorus capsularis TaxID=210143 RepID=A0A1R3IBA2_COCAP|nr:hypothetical protein CCACVL1_13342 [Corchorus capsularis]
MEVKVSGPNHFHQLTCPQTLRLVKQSSVE